MQGFWCVTIKYVTLITLIFTYLMVTRQEPCMIHLILQYFTTLNYELFCKRNGIPLGAHFIYLNSGTLLGLKMTKK